MDLTIGSRLLPVLTASNAQRFEVEVRVKDTGIGISPAQLAKLFRSFSQVQHVSGEYGGTGLGLVISRRLIEAMQGEIHVDSAAGQGSCFSFKLPCESASVVSIGPGAGGSLSNKSSPFVAPRLLAIGMPSTAMGMASPMSRTRSLLIAGGPNQSEDNLTDILSRPHAHAHASASASSSSPSSPSSAASAAAAQRDDLASTQRNIHGLLAHERQKMEQTTILFVGERSAAADSWIRTCELYGSTVHVSRTIVEGHDYLVEQQQQARSRSETSPFSQHTGCSPQSPSSSYQSRTTPPHTFFSGHSGFAPVVAAPVPAPAVAALFGVVVIDLDSSSASGSPVSSEDACAEMLAGLGPLRILCLYTKQHMAMSSADRPSEKHAHISSGSSGSGSGSGANQPSQPVIVHLPDTETASASPSPPPLPPMVDHAAAAVAVDSTAVAAAAAPASPPIPYSRLCDSSALVVSAHSVEASSLTVTRSLRRPFKMAAYLRAILKLRSATPTNTNTDATATATPASASSADRSRRTTPEALWPFTQHQQQQQSGSGAATGAAGSGGGCGGGDTGSAESNAGSATGRRQTDCRRVGSPLLSSRRLISASPSSSSRCLVSGSPSSSSSRRLTGPSSSSSSPSSSHRSKITSISASYPLRILLAEVSQHSTATTDRSTRLRAFRRCSLIACVLRCFRHLQDNVMNQKLMVRVNQRQQAATEGKQQYCSSLSQPLSDS